MVFVYDAYQLYSLDGVRANHFLQQLRLDLMAPLYRQFGVGFSGEYFDRRTYYKQEENETRKFHYPAVPRLPDLEILVSARPVRVLLVSLACLVPAGAWAQNLPDDTPDDRR